MAKHLLVLFQQSEAELKKLEVDLNLDWSSDGPVFAYDTQMSTSAAARAFAKETWNKQFFQDLKK